jgi:hypothetical protein
VPGPTVVVPGPPVVVPGPSTYIPVPTPGGTSSTPCCPSITLNNTCDKDCGTTAQCPSGGTCTGTTGTDKGTTGTGTGTGGATGASKTTSHSKATWALLNLLLVILAATVVIMRVIAALMRRRGTYREDLFEFTDSDGNVWQSARRTTEQDVRDKDGVRRTSVLGVVLRVIAVLLTLAAVAIFCLTEDVRNHMMFIDKWTIWMVLITLVVIAVIIADIFLSRAVKTDDDEDDYVEDEQDTDESDKGGSNGIADGGRVVGSNGGHAVGGRVVGSNGGHAVGGRAIGSSGDHAVGGSGGHAVGGDAGPGAVRPPSPLTL